MTPPALNMAQYLQKLHNFLPLGKSGLAQVNIVSTPTVLDWNSRQRLLYREVESQSAGSRPDGQAAERGIPGLFVLRRVPPCMDA